MKLVSDVKRSAKRFYHKHPKLTVYGGIGAGVALFGGIVYAATRPKKKSAIESMLAVSSTYAQVSVLRGIEIAALTKRLTAMADLLGNGTPIFLQADAFRKIFTHGGVKVIDLILAAFYNKENKFTTDELASHSHCQTLAAAVVQLGNDWAYPFFNTVYRGPDIIKTCGVDLQCDPRDKGKQIRYAGNAIDPHADPGAFNAAVVASMEASIKKGLDSGDFGGVLTALKKYGITLPFSLPGDVSSLFMFAMPAWTRDRLAQFARDLAKKNDKTLPTTDSEGKPLPQKSLTMLHASVGGMMIAGLIDMFESHDEKVNPCIKVVDAGMVFEMFMATIGTVFSLAFGPALSALSVVIKIATTINKLAELSK